MNASPQNVIGIFPGWFNHIWKILKLYLIFLESCAQKGWDLMTITFDEKFCGSQDVVCTS